VYKTDHLFFVHNNPGFHKAGYGRTRRRARNIPDQSGVCRLIVVFQNAFTVSQPENLVKEVCGRGRRDGRRAVPARGSHTPRRRVYFFEAHCCFVKGVFQKMEQGAACLDVAKKICIVKYGFRKMK
jgi:hypothetical protein